MGMRLGGWFWFFADHEVKFDPDKCGKWMCFFSDQQFAIEICKKAVEQNACFECKCSDLEVTGEQSGVICFYLEADDIDNHKRVIRFMIENDLIRRTKTGKLYIIGFKFDNQTRAGEYGSDFKSEIKLEKFVDLNTGEGINE